MLQRVKEPEIALVKQPEGVLVTGMHTARPFTEFSIELRGSLVARFIDMTLLMCAPTGIGQTWAEWLAWCLNGTDDPLAQQKCPDQRGRDMERAGSWLSRIQSLKRPLSGENSHKHAVK